MSTFHVTFEKYKNKMREMVYLPINLPRLLNSLYRNKTHIILIAWYKISLRISTIFIKSPLVISETIQMEKGPSWSWWHGSWIYNYLCNQCLSSLMLHKQGVLDKTLCDKVCQWLATCWWFSQSTPVSSTNKTDHHDITAILLKVVLNTITLTLTPDKVYIIIPSLQSMHRNLRQTLRTPSLQLFCRCLNIL